MKTLANYYVSWLWPLSVVFLQVTFSYYGNLPINVGLISVTLLVLVCFPFLSIPFNVANSILGLIFITLLYVFWANNYIEFFKSFFQIVLLLLVILTVLGSATSFRIKIMHAVIILINVGLVVACLIICQAVFWNIGLIDWFVAPLGEWTPYGPGGKIYTPTETMMVKRPNGVYSEPSIAGWMMSYLVAISWSAKHLECISRYHLRNWPPIVFSIAAILTGSVTGLVGVLTVWLAISFTRSNNTQAHKGKLIAIIIFLSVTVIGINTHKPVRDYFYTRITSASEPGTSIYYRLVAPTLLVNDSLIDFPMGHPVGQTSYIESKDYMVNWEGGSSTNIDNSFFLVVFYYGWTGLIAILFGLLWFVRLVMIGSVVAPLVSAQVVALMATGALWSPWIALMIGFTIAVIVNLNRTYAGALCRKQKKDINASLTSV